MVAIQEAYRSESDAWWAWSPVHGWVVLDRGVFQNRVTHRPDKYRFLRCRDWAEYEQGRQAWNYREAGKYLASLPAGAAAEAQAELARRQEEFAERMA